MEQTGARFNRVRSACVSVVRWIINLCSDLDRKWTEVAGGLAEQYEAFE